MNDDNPRLGIILVVTGLCIAAFTGALMKKLSVDLSAYQITWFRYLGFVVILFPIVAIRFGGQALKPARPWMQGVRGLTMATGTVAFVIGARTINFADAISILYAYPFLLTVLAVLFLKERVGWQGWVGVAGGFLGVLLVIRPEFGQINIGSLFVFGCAVIVSIQMILNRKLGAISHPLVTSIWGGAIATLLLSAFVPFHWNPVNFDHALLLVLMAVSGAANQVCLVYGFARAEASTLAPFTYLEIVASVIIGFLMFGTFPIWISWIGIALIIISGIVVAHSMKGDLVPRRNPRI